MFLIDFLVYKLLLKASGLPKTSRYLHTRLRLERDKLVFWGILANLSEDERTLGSGMRLNKHKVNDNLQEIRLLLSDLVKRCVCYELAQVTKHSEDGSADDASETISLKSNSTLQRKALCFISQTRHFPQHLGWVPVDKQDFTVLLAKLTALNDGMMHFLERGQQGRYFQMQQDTFMGILEANDDFDELLSLMASLNATKAFTGTPAHIQRLLQLARLKAFNVAIEEAKHGVNEDAIKSRLGDSPARSRRTLLENHRFCKRENLNPGDQPIRTWGNYETTPIWVEWRYCMFEAVPVDNRKADLRIADERVGNGQNSSRHMEDHICKLATLLRDRHKPEEIRVPSCLGYIHEVENNRLGLVFERTGERLPLSLFEMLTPPMPKPSLTARVQIARAIATTIWFLHATNWLHKSLRSDNIIFPSPFSTSPYLTGFDYSRPTNPSDVVERLGENRHHDLYRHPLAQFHFPRNGTSGFTKLYDIYSLGVVLYEIGMWKPIHVILGINERTRSAAATDVQTRLLSQESLMSLAAEVGDIYMATVASCLSGDFGFDGFDGRDDRQTNYEARLQLEFGERVIRKLDSITV